ncbi:hypothetical protein SNE40_020084 [Patella caerulea]|uniref:Uncharacterized protein n=1 Tax=Patella caerulea TaxID=87958 RepID=A0AAN8G6V3_PATCE
MVLSSLLGCVVATMCVYSTPFILSFNRYRKIRHERIKKISSRFIKEGSVRKVDSDTRTTDSDVTRITDSSFSDNVGNAPTSSSSSSNSQESADDFEDQSNFMEVVGAAQMKEPVENSEKFCQDCGDNSTKTCDCCPSK